MAEFIDRLSGELGEDWELDDDMRETLLELAADVAHTTERINAPMTAYLAGRFVATRMASGEAEHTALDAFLEIVDRALTDD